jgi:hypothetical protein
MEVHWRRLFTRRSARVCSAARLDVYGPNGRNHLYGIIGGGALHSAFRLIRDAEESGRRRMARAELARVLHRLGCRVAPGKWHPTHILEGLRAALEKPRGRRAFFEHIVMLRAEATDGECGIAWIQGEAGDPLLPNHYLWQRGHTSTPIFERSGLGIPYEYGLATAGIVDIDDIRGAAVGGPALLEFEAARRRWPLLVDTSASRASFDRLREAVARIPLPPVRHGGPFLSLLTSTRGSTALLGQLAPSSSALVLDGRPLPLLLTPQPSPNGPQP